MCPCSFICVTRELLAAVFATRCAIRGHKSRRRKQNAHVAIDSHISAPVWWVLRAVASQVAGPGGHDADAPVDVAIELCASSDAYIDG